MSKPFRSDKRKKELQRLQKQEEKRLRRFGKKQEMDETAEGEPIENENGPLETDGMSSNSDQTEGEASDNTQSEG